ncbi:O-antigen ligase family protein [Paraclostridium sordellii]|uniref:O-antigen ligase family protein n=1 Tax=Paraclostridium sordellii TaxID=1505 RepID=UPI001F05669D|nr:O-antigen ligase family protein [Paeniclostridium sordellii]MCH1967187.1 O-antigen ligase family protein [Paeniclostridium sordellii]
MILGIFLIIFGFTIETFFSIPDITIPLLFILTTIVIMHSLKTNSFYCLKRCDIYIYLFVIYLLLHSFIRSDITIVLMVVVGSFFPYFLGRYITVDNQVYIFIKKVVIIIGWIIIFKLLIEYFKSSEVRRVTIEGSNVIANGELLGIFALVNLFNLNGINKDFVSIFNYISGLLSCLILIGSRGTTMFIVITTLIMYAIIYKINFRFILYIFSIIIGYIILFSTDSIFIEKFPILGRFTIDGILHDPSIVGSSHNIGRLQLYEQSINAFQYYPIFGIGVMKIYSHNIFLEILSTLGIIGFVIFTIWIIEMIFKCMKIGKNNAVIVALFIYTFLYRQSSFTLNAHKSLFIFAGMVVAIYNNQKIKNRINLK